MLIFICKPSRVLRRILMLKVLLLQTFLDVYCRLKHIFLEKFKKNILHRRIAVRFWGSSADTLAFTPGHSKAVNSLPCSVMNELPEGEEFARGALAVLSLSDVLARLIVHICA